MPRVILVGAAFIVLTACLAVVLTVLGLLRLPGRGAVSIAYSRMVCAMLAVRIHNVGEPPRGKPVLILANHVSWLDILVITAAAPVIFVAKSEVAAWPLIGRVARARGTVFVERQRRHRTAAANVEIARFLAEGQSIVLFAEGTSSDGNRVLPFRSALVGALKDALEQAGVDAGIAVQPLSVAYTRVHGLPMGRHNRPLVAWYGERELVPHVDAFIRCGAVDATLSWGEPVPYDGAHRKQVVAALEQSVRTMTAAALSGRPVAASASTSRPLFPPVAGAGAL